MQLTTFPDVAQFSQRAEPFLMTHEAEHNLLLGICSGLLAQPAPQPDDAPPYLAVIEDDGEVIAVAVRTPPYPLVLSLIPRAELTEEALALLIEDLSQSQPDLSGVTGPTALAKAFADRWHERTGHSYHLRDNQRIYKLTAVRPVRGVPGTMRRAAANDRDLLVRWIAAFNAEAFHHEPDVPEAERWVNLFFQGTQRELYLWEDGGQPVSLAGCTGRTPNGMRVGPVYTPPELRGRGYASACTAAVSQMLLDRGLRFCFLFTDLANPTSNHIYQQIGYEPVSDVDAYLFD